MRKLGGPVFGQLVGLVGDLVDVACQRQGHDIGLQTVNHRAGLLAGAPVRLIDGDRLARPGLPVGCEGGVELLVELARRIIGHVEQGAVGEGLACLKRQEQRSGTKGN